MDDAELDFYRKRYKKFSRNFGGEKNKQVREARIRGEGTKEQLADFRELQKDYNKFFRLKRNRNKPAKPDPSTYKVEYVNYLHDRFAELGRLKRSQPELWHKLNSRHQSVPAEDQKQYDSLSSDSKEYRRWERWSRRSTAGEYSPEARATLDANRDGATKYKQKYHPTHATAEEKAQLQAEAARLKARQGTPAELAAFDKIWEQYKAYHRTFVNHNYGKKKTIVEVPEDVSGIVEKMEIIREKAKEWRREFKGNPELQRKMENGEGTRAELTRYHDLKEAWSQYTTEYMRGFRRTEKSRLVEGASGAGRTVRMRISGEQGLFRPNYNTRKRVANKSKVLPKKTSGPDDPDKNDPPKNDGSPSEEGSENTPPENGQAEDPSSEANKAILQRPGLPNSSATTTTPPLHGSKRNLSKASTPFLSPSKPSNTASASDWLPKLADATRKIDPGAVFAGALKGLAGAVGKGQNLVGAMS